MVTNSCSISLYIHSTLCLLHCLSLSPLLLVFDLDPLVVSHKARPEKVSIKGKELRITSCKFFSMLVTASAFLTIWA